MCRSQVCRSQPKTQNPPAARLGMWLDGGGEQAARVARRLRPAAALLGGVVVQHALGIQHKEPGRGQAVQSVLGMRDWGCEAATHQPYSTPWESSTKACQGEGSAFWVGCVKRWPTGGLCVWRPPSRGTACHRSAAQGTLQGAGLTQGPVRAACHQQTAWQAWHGAALHGMTWLACGICLLCLQLPGPAVCHTTATHMHPDLSCPAQPYACSAPILPTTHYSTQLCGT